jgi:hypothetical protein
VKQSWSVRDWVTIGLFGALWGAVEISLGSVLHILFPPLTDTFLVGLIMAFLGCVIALCGRVFVPRRGSILLIGVITAILKAFSLGGIKIGPMAAILAESLLMEAALLPFAAASAAGFALAGMLAVSWNFFHRFIMMRLLFGTEFIAVGLKMARDGARLLGIREELLLPVLALLLLIRLAAGLAAGLLARVLGRQVAGRLRRESG